MMALPGLTFVKLLFVHFHVVPPEIPVPPVNTIVVSGDEVVFNCTAVGDPLPTINWYIRGVGSSLPNMVPFDDDGLFDDSFIDTMTINTTTVMSSLTINETIPFLAEDYVCVASNSLGNASSTATLTVLGKFYVLVSPFYFVIYSSTIYIGIIKVGGFWPKNIAPKPA